MNIFPGQVQGNTSFDCSLRNTRSSGRSGENEDFVRVLRGSGGGRSQDRPSACEQGACGQDRVGQAQARPEGMRDTADAEERTEILDLLKQQGVPEDLIEEIKGFLEQNPKLSLGEMLQQIAAVLEGVVQDSELSPVDHQSLKLLLDKSGMGQEAIDAALGDLQQGDWRGFLDRLQAALAEQGKGFHVSRRELAALARALGLDGGTLNQDGQQANHQGLQPVGSDELNTLEQLLDSRTGASSQELKAALAGLREIADQGSRHHRPHGEEIAQLGKQLRQILDEQARKPHESGPQQVQPDMQPAVKSNHDSGHGVVRDQGPGSGLKGVLAQGGHNMSGSGSGLGQDGQAGGSGDGEENPWKSLLDRLNQVQDRQGAESKAGDVSLTKSDHHLKSLGDKAETAKEILQRPNIRQSVVDQVKGGMLKNLGQGKNELTLQLNPPDLGKMSLVLQVQNKDVLGTIKTSNPEVTRFIQQNLHTIQQGLEQQGLRVHKLDVQTQLAQEDSSQWFGQEGHNQAREQRQQMEQRGWLRHWQDGEWLDPDMDDLGPEDSLQLLNRDGLSVLA